MKKYISAILINTLLIQFAGCYSQREITYDDFYSLPRTEEVTIENKNGDIFDLDSDSLRYDYIKWEKSKDAITLYPTHLEKYSTTALIKVADTFYYPKENISKIYIDEYDESKTIMGIVVGAIFVTLIIVVASNYTFQIY
ncbi:MAG TPA: hypothetical protein VLH59_01450 [Ignavibacteriaceae bacterium]|nr:hypothetical protein [Ignavibacteriaceae bacterium]